MHEAWVCGSDKLGEWCVPKDQPTDPNYPIPGRMELDCTIRGTCC